MRLRRLGPRVGLFGVAAATLAIDQITKSAALAALSDGPIELVWTLRLRLSFNTGAAFGLGRGLGGLLVLAGVALVVLLIVAVRGVSTWTVGVGAGLVVGGAVGNLADRVFRSHDGAVVDFIDLQWWPVFNLADVAITTGAVVLVFLGSRSGGPT